MDVLLHAPATRALVTNKHVLAVVDAVLGEHCKQVALKEMSVFEVQPGAGATIASVSCISSLLHQLDIRGSWTDANREARFSSSRSVLAMVCPRHDSLSS